MSAVAIRRGFTALALTVVLGGCRVGTDLPGSEPVELEMNEAVEVTTAVLDATLQNSVYSDAHAAFTHQHGTAALHEHPITGPFVHDGGVLDGPALSHHNQYVFDLSTEVACALGGSVLMESEITGEGDPRLGIGRVQYTTVQTHNACAVSIGAGAEFVLDAAPYLTAEAFATNDGTVAQVYGSLLGGVSWDAEAKAGTCEVDLQYTGSAVGMPEIEMLRVTGTFCGMEIDANVPRS